ncbi:lytic transglycosylase domain-containing protein [Bernardetia litoralis]|uniref:lytic transglycosylase domain-containing protein n=1 Tax=Bernardetia litoralis TaxID=999 RepID=UPI0002F97A06|nr:lytic transglycosylase domain-containing protein [Bernardetia litoralis]
MKTTYFSFSLVLLFLITTFSSCVAQQISDIQTVMPIKIPDTVYFAGERIPLEDEDVKERLDRELISIIYGHASTMLLLKRSGRWRKPLEDSLTKYGVHKDFFYLAIAESALDPLIKSNRDALGTWQFLEGTGKQFGLIINDNIDERQDPLKSCVAATKYFHQAYKKFESWASVAASYNRGMAGLEKAMDNQGTRNYYDLFLNSETSRYVLRIAALKMVLENPKKYGYCIEEYEYYNTFEFDEITITENIESVPKWAKKQGMTYKEFRLYNPAIAINDNKYNFIVPKGGYVFRVKKKK